MPISLPRFGSLYVLDMAKSLSKHSFTDAYNAEAVIWNWGFKEPVTTYSMRDGGSLVYVMTLPTGEKRAVTLSCGDKSIVTHIVSGVEGSQNSHTVNRSLPFLFSVEGLRNLCRQYIGKSKPLTVEEASDRCIEARLNRHQVPYHKLSFDAWGSPVS